MMHHLAYYQLDHLSLIKVSGVDALKFLQGQISANVAALLPNQAQLSALCNPQGRIISLFYLILTEENYYLILEKSLLSLTLNTLKKYAVFFKVNLGDESAPLQVYGLAAKDSGLNNASALEQPPVAPTYLLLSSKHLRYFMINSSVPNEKDIRPYAEWKTIDLLESIPHLYPATSGKFLPHECGLHELNAISFEKGCFTGQEIIARMHYRGKTKFTLRKVTLHQDAVLKPGEDIYKLEKNEKTACGTIVDSVFLRDQEQLALILIQDQDMLSEHVFSESGNYFIFKV